LKSGFVAILGRPNVGKSTLLNALVGVKVAIVTPKPQTTRDAIQGVLTRQEGQIVFVDSPGIHRPALEIGRRMMQQVSLATSGCHLALLVVDAAAPTREEDREALALIKQLKVPAFLVLNKIDAVKAKDQLLPRIEEFKAGHNFDEYVPVSALRPENLDLLVKLIFERLPDSPPYYPEDYITDQPERFLVAELIREQIILGTEQEVPHAAAVMVDHWEESPKLLRISATIYCERPGQKGILIGQGGSKLKQIGSRARQEIEAYFGRKVFLELFVKVRPKWRDHSRFVRELDFHKVLGIEAEPGSGR